MKKHILFLISLSALFIASCTVETTIGAGEDKNEITFKLNGATQSYSNNITAFDNINGGFTIKGELNDSTGISLYLPNDRTNTYTMAGDKDEAGINLHNFRFTTDSGDSISTYRIEVEESFNGRVSGTFSATLTRFISDETAEITEGRFSVSN